MAYKVFLHPKANSFIAKAEKELQDTIRKKLRTLSHKPETGEKLRHSDFWRLRIGDYRAIYEIDRNNNQIIVLYIGHRREVYDDFSRLFWTCSVSSLSSPRIKPEDCTNELFGRCRSRPRWCSERIADAYLATALRASAKFALRSNFRYASAVIWNSAWRV